MAKQQTQRIGLVQVDSDVDTSAPPNEQREALAVAIANHAALTAAISENLTSQKRADEAWFTANRGVDAANQAIEDAKQADAEAIAEGRAIGAAKAARTALTDAEDQRDAAKSARTMLTDQAADLSNRLAISDVRVKAAVAAVIHQCPKVRELIERWRTAQLNLHEMREAVSALATHFPSATNNAWWETSGLPRYFRFWDNVDWERDLPPSATAARVKTWLERLRADADAVLE
jgi:flagellar biosynthesis/type III secretory pathway protein FliH